MPLCSYCLQVVEKEHPMIRVANQEPTVDHHATFRALQSSGRQCELCRAILDSLKRDGHLDEDPEQAFRGLKLRVEVNHYLCNPYQSNPQSSNDISAWGLRAYWVREVMPTGLILCKDLGELPASYSMDL